MKTPTIYDIKYDTQGKSPYFFSRDTLKFFGQTMRSFHVRKSPSGRIFIYAPMIDYRKHFMGYTWREYKDHNLINVNFSGLYQDINAILDYIQSH